MGWGKSNGTTSLCDRCCTTECIGGAKGGTTGPFASLPVFSPSLNLCLPHRRPYISAFCRTGVLLAFRQVTGGVWEPLRTSGAGGRTFFKWASAEPPAALGGRLEGPRGSLCCSQPTAYAVAYLKMNWKLFFTLFDNQFFLFFFLHKCICSLEEFRAGMEQTCFFNDSGDDEQYKGRMLLFLYESSNVWLDAKPI